MTKEQVFSHNQVKTELGRVGGNLVKETKMGRYFGDGVFLTNVEADLACKPDGVFVSFDSFETQRVRLVEGAKEGYVELEGSADMTLEVVSDSSVAKDTTVLAEAYFLAGVQEYWVIDARGDRLDFDIFRRGKTEFEKTPKRDGWICSAVFQREFQLVRTIDALGQPEYTLNVRSEKADSK